MLTNPSSVIKSRSGWRKAAEADRNTDTPWIRPWRLVSRVHARKRSVYPLSLCCCEAAVSLQKNPVHTNSLQLCQRSGTSEGGLRRAQRDNVASRLHNVPAFVRFTVNSASGEGFSALSLKDDIHLIVMQKVYPPVHKLSLTDDAVNGLCCFLATAPEK